MMSMLIVGDQPLGRFKVELEVANNNDVVEAELGHLDPAKVRRVKLMGVVDCGASRLVLPKSVVSELGLVTSGKVKVIYADRRSAKRDRVQGVFLTLLGRNSVFSAIVEPKRDTALIGAIVLEELDLLVDSAKEQLIVRDPHGIVSEIE